MFDKTIPFKLCLPCKDCHRVVSESETEAYRLIAGVLYGWCTECFKSSRRSNHTDRFAFNEGDGMKIRSAISTELANCR